MTSTIKVNTITTESGSTLTVGGCGKTVALASGASQSGFGRSGTVDWQTGSIKTSTFTAVNGQGFFADTSSSGFTMNLPAGTAGNIVSVADYTNTFQNNSLTITPNGSQKIGGINASVALSTEGQSVTLVYVDDTEGWKNIQDSTSNVVGNPFLTASGGTETTSGNYKIHTFTGPGTFTVSNASSTADENIVSYLVVAGGASGGAAYGGGAGAGGFREYKGPADSYTASPLNGNPGGTAVTVTAQAYPITVGGGGTARPGTPPAQVGAPGNPSVFSTITSTGGGGGGAGVGSPFAALPGGSGGGAGRDETTNNGSGNTPPVSPPQGNNGGQPSGSSWNGGGGGGGAGGVGGNGSGGSPGSEVAGNGGNGATTSINATPTIFAGGGGGSIGGTNCSGGTGGPGGGGAGKSPSRPAGVAGTANTGGGGGAGHSCGASGTGGSGIVIIRYKYQ